MTITNALYEDIRVSESASSESAEFLLEGNMFQS